MYKKILLFLLLGFSQLISAQNRDSLRISYNNKNLADTSRLQALTSLALSYYLTEPDSAITLANQLIIYSKKVSLKKYEAKALYIIGRAYNSLNEIDKAVENFKKAVSINIAIDNKPSLFLNYQKLGQIYYYSFDYTAALDYYNKGLAVAQQTGVKSDIAFSYCDIGDVYFALPNLPVALKNYLTALKMAEEAKDLMQMGACYRAIGSVYSYQHDSAKAIEYNKKALNIAIKQNINDHIALVYSRLAAVYNDWKDFKQSEKHYRKALSIYLKMDYLKPISDCYIGLGNVFNDQEKRDTAIFYYQKALAIKEQTNEKEGLLVCYINMGNLYLKNNDSKSALEYQKKGLAVAKEVNHLYYTAYAYEALSSAQAKLGQYKDAYENYVQFKVLTDSIFNEDNTKQLSDLKTNFEVEKKENELKLKATAEQDKLKAITKEEKKIQYIIILSVTGVLLIVIVFSVFLYKRFTITKQQKRIIEIKSEETAFQKHLIEEKQKEIIDSITYAKRLQQAILPPADFINIYLKNNFVLYQPKDIVAGDFYWMYVANEVVYIAAADSTGHGVPGAMVSIVCSNALDKAVKEFGLTDTGKILDKTTDLVLETFAKSGEEIKDGMDISLLSIDFKNKKISWSGANNALLYMTPSNSLCQIKPDKQPIGKSDHRKPFTIHQVDYIIGTTFYLMTDGYPDQFGGPKGKKYKYRQLEELLIANSHLSLPEQSNLLLQSFTSWKGDLEQVDDVTIIGIKI